MTLALDRPQTPMGSDSPLLVPLHQLAHGRTGDKGNRSNISVIAYRKPASPEQKAKAWAVYRDDVTDLDGLAASLKQTIPETCQWQSETVHE